MRIALIDKGSGTVVNVIEAPAHFAIPDPQIEIKASDDAQIGWQWNGVSFTRPPTPLARRIPPGWNGFRNEAEISRLPEERRELAAYAQIQMQLAWLGPSWDETALYQLYKLLAKLTQEKTDALAAMDGAFARLLSRIESGELASEAQVDEAIAHGPGIPQ